MAKYYGKIGFCVTAESAPGVWAEDEIEERNYYGELTRNTRRLQGREYQTSYSKVLNPGQMINLPEGYYNGNRIMANSRNIGTVTFHLPEKNDKYENVTLTTDVGHTILGMATGRVINYRSCIWKEEIGGVEWYNNMLVDLSYSGSTVKIVVTIRNWSTTVVTDLTFSYMY